MLSVRALAACLVLLVLYSASREARAATRCTDTRLDQLYFPGKGNAQPQNGIDAEFVVPYGTIGYPASWLVYLQGCDAPMFNLWWGGNTWSAAGFDSVGNLVTDVVTVLPGDAISFSLDEVNRDPHWSVWFSDDRLGNSTLGTVLTQHPLTCTGAMIKTDLYNCAGSALTCADLPGAIVFSKFNESYCIDSACSEWYFDYGNLATAQNYVLGLGSCGVTGYGSYSGDYAYMYP